MPVLVIKFEYPTDEELKEAKKMFEGGDLPNLVSVEEDE